MTWKTAGIDSCRYDAGALWVLRDELAGSAARRFAGRVDLFFRAGERSLLVDLREAGPIDSVGAAALRASRDTHPGFGVVGRPRSFDDCPGAVRRALLALDAAPDLETALGAPAGARGGAGERRRCPRIGLQLPVALCARGRTAPATLRDISRGGMQLALVPEGWFAGDGADRSFDVLGVTDDPLGRELFAHSGRAPLAALALRAPGDGTVAARFAGSPPPV